jgi:hypothetical protein
MSPATRWWPLDRPHGEARKDPAFEYRRGGTLACLAAWDVHHASLFDRVEPKTGIEPFGRLVEPVMTSEPHASARTVSTDRGQRFTPRRAWLDRAARGRPAEPAARPPPDPRLLAQPDRALLLDRPAQGVQPNSFDSLDELPDRLLRLGEHDRQIARPFDCTFTHADPERVLATITERQPRLALAA